MRVTISFDMANAAFDGNPEDEVTRVLRAAADFVLNSTEETHPLRDSNGNTIGSVNVEGYL